LVALQKKRWVMWKKIINSFEYIPSLNAEYLFQELSDPKRG